MEMLKEGLVVRNLGRIEEAEEAALEGELALPPDAEYKDLVQMGITKERRSFRLYARLAGLVADKATRDVLFQLAEEEARHMVQFESEYARLMARGE
jgi:rubrerythrin